MQILSAIVPEVVVRLVCIARIVRESTSWGYQNETRVLSFYQQLVQWPVSKVLEKWRKVSWRDADRVLVLNQFNDPDPNRTTTFENKVYLEP